MKYGSRRRARQQTRHPTHWIAAHARLKNLFTEDEKYHKLMPWLIEDLGGIFSVFSRSVFPEHVPSFSISAIKRTVAKVSCSSLSGFSLMSISSVNLDNVSFASLTVVFTGLCVICEPCHSVYICFKTASFSSKSICQQVDQM